MNQFYQTIKPKIKLHLLQYQYSFYIDQSQQIFQRKTISEQINQLLASLNSPIHYPFKPQQQDKLSFKEMAENKKEQLQFFVDQLTENITNFLQEVKALFPQQFLNNINHILQAKQIKQMKLNSSGHKQNSSFAHKLLEINHLCLYHLAQKVTQLQEQSENSLHSKSARSQQKVYNHKDYQVLEEAVQKAEQQIRKHIGIEHQMKICLEQVQEELNQIATQNQQLKKQNTFLKKQLSSAKKKQIEAIKKLNETEEKIQLYQQKMRTTKALKINTEPQATLINDTSRKSLKKTFENKQKEQKRPLITKTLGHTKLGSRKQSKLGIIENDIDISLNSFITLSMQMKKQQMSLKTEGKQTFWNKRLKKKESATAHGTYGDFSTIQKSQNQSLNISPRQLRKRQKQKQKQLKNVYAINVRETKKASLTMPNEETVLKKRQRNNCPNKEGYQIRRGLTVNSNGPDRSKSVAY